MSTGYQIKKEGFRNYGNIESLMDVVLIDMPWKTYC
jgi:hypothetical protein